jgi:NhaC family Na+:H+ antiporter
VDVIIGFVATFLLLLAGMKFNIFMVFPLFAGLLIFLYLSVRRGYRTSDVITMAYEGGKKALVVLKIFILIGVIIPVWISAGTVPSIVFYGFKIIEPNLFIVSSFIVNCIISFLIGTSFGTIGTAGVAFMIMGRSGGVNVNILAGAIIAGAYFGDRCSPVSSSASLIAGLTGTNIYTNVKNMFKSALVPLIISIFAYGLLSYMYPLKIINNAMEQSLDKNFYIGFIALIPAIILLLAAIFKLEVKLSMMISIVAGILISTFYQGYSASKIIQYIITGFELPKNNELFNILKGGGIISMLKLSLIVFVSSAFAGIFEKTGMLNGLEKRLIKLESPQKIFAAVIILSIITSSFGCTQAIAVILTYQLVNKIYDKKGISKDTLALDIENTAIVIAPLIPWNIAGLLPASNLLVSYGYIPFAFFLYLIPIWAYFRRRKKSILC